MDKYLKIVTISRYLGFFRSQVSFFGLKNGKNLQICPRLILLYQERTGVRRIGNG